MITGKLMEKETKNKYECTIDEELELAYVAT